MGILKLLIELYHYGELKLNLKFEIEVLCKALEVELKEVKPTEMLKKQDELSQQRQEVEEVKAAARLPAAAQQQQAEQQHSHLLIKTVIGWATGTLNPNNVPSGGTSITATKPLENAGPNNLPAGSHSLSLNGQAGYASSLQLVEQSVTIANILTQEMILKDFAMEGKEDQMRTLAHMMVKHLAGLSALVTTKEPPTAPRLTLACPDTAGKHASAKGAFNNNNHHHCQLDSYDVSQQAAYAPADSFPSSSPAYGRY
ncbi:hypothetical protein PtB15_17B441 [Puccinia triticina]|nr:hypothetical protein PtB15_17B441 [Puccinia triticina]